jgi:hypothetical protein
MTRRTWGLSRFSRSENGTVPFGNWGLVRGPLLIAALLAACWPGFAQPALAQSKAASTLEEQLMQDLGSDPLDADVHRELFAPDDQAPAGEPDAAKDDLEQRLLDELGAAAVSEDANPLLDVARQMRLVEAKIGRTETGPATQDAQRDIIARLDELLKQAKKNCSGGQCSPSQNQPQQTAQRSQINQPKPQKQPGPGEKSSDKPVRNPEARAGSSTPKTPDMDEMRSLLKAVWGELPAGQREQMLELPVEEFLPKYELLIEAYFKRLAEQQEVDQWPATRVPPE